MIPSHGYAAQNATAPLTPHKFQRREVGEHDVLIDILYCGICHSDIHTVRGDWGPAHYPLVPGHEIVGKVAKVGSAVRKWKVGDTVGVGCIVNSCKTCSACKEGLEQFCEKGMVGTYNAKDKDGTITQGGYASNIVVNEEFVLKIPEKLDLAHAAPLLCAGITTYSPLRHWKVSKGQKVGVVGLGGLGHMALKLAHSMGAHVVQFTRSKHKIEDAKKLGADEIILSTDPAQMQKHAGTFDFILDTVSAQHDLNSLLGMLKRDGHLIVVGGVPEPLDMRTFSLIMGRKSLAGSLIGGIKETQEMLDYCAQHGIHADVEVIPIQKVNEAYERTLKSDVKYRFVIDMASVKHGA